MKIFTVYDSKAEAHLPPFFTKTVGLALRSFEEATNQEGHQFSKHAADYTLFEIGEYNETTGNIRVHAAKINLGTALQFIQQAVDPMPQVTETIQWVKDQQAKG